MKEAMTAMTDLALTVDSKKLKGNKIRETDSENDARGDCRK